MGEGWKNERETEASALKEEIDARISGKSRERDASGRFVKGNGVGKSTRFKLGNEEQLKYKPEYAERIIKYFSGPICHIEYVETFDGEGKVTKRTPLVITDDYPTFEAFATSIGVVSNTLRNWCEQYEDFAFAYGMAKDIQRGKIISGAMTGKYNPLFAKFEAVNNHGMSDKTQTEYGITTLSLPSGEEENAN